MTKQRERFYRWLFLTAAVYDIILGLVFLFLPRQAFALIGAANAFPDHAGFVWLIGSFLFVIGVAYALIYRGDLRRNKDLIAVGTLYKLAYAAVAFFTLFVGEYPHLAFVLIFGVADVIFFVLMAECWLFIARVRNEPVMAL